MNFEAPAISDGRRLIRLLVGLTTSIILLALSTATAQAQSTATQYKQAGAKKATATVQEAGEKAENGPSVKAQAGNEKQTLVFADGRATVAARQGASSELTGPLAGTLVSTRDMDGDMKVGVILIARQDCDLIRGRTASFVLEDVDGTQADFVEGAPPNGDVEIEKFSEGLRITSSETNTNDVRPLNVRGRTNDVLNTDGLRIVTSTGIVCDGGSGGAVAAANDAKGSAAEELSDLGCDRLLQKFRNVSGSQYGFADPEVEARIVVCLQQEVINNTAADEDLPDTGGLPLLGLAVLGLASLVAGVSVIHGARRGE